MSQVLPSNEVERGALVQAAPRMAAPTPNPGALGAITQPAVGTIVQAAPRMAAPTPNPGTLGANTQPAVGTIVQAAPRMAAPTPNPGTLGANTQPAVGTLVQAAPSMAAPTPNPGALGANTQPVAGTLLQVAPSMAGPTPGHVIELDDSEELGTNTHSVVKEEIERAKNNPEYSDLLKNIEAPEPDWGSVTYFFDLVNQNISRANRAANLNENNGKIPNQDYQNIIQDFETKLNRAENEADIKGLCDITLGKIASFNLQHQLPWSFELCVQHLVNKKLGSNLDEVTQHRTEDEESNGFNLSNEIQEQVQAEGQQEYNHGESVDDVLADTRQALHGEGKVLFWWKRGTGSQIFVRYGSVSAPIYRIRAGSQEPYDPNSVPRLFSANAKHLITPANAPHLFTPGAVETQPRGHEKTIVTGSDQLPVESWKWNRNDVNKIIGIGWKVNGDDETIVKVVDDDGYAGPLDYINPKKNDGNYPDTRILIKWTDGKVSLENRSFFRRIMSPCLADNTIYRMAVKAEIKYRQVEGQGYEDLENMRAVMGDREHSLEASNSPPPNAPASRHTTARPAVTQTGRAMTPGPADIPASQQATPGPEVTQTRATTPGPAPQGVTPRSAVTGTPRNTPARVNFATQQSASDVYANTFATREDLDELNAKLNQVLTLIAPPQNKTYSPQGAWAATNRHQSDVSESPEPWTWRGQERWRGASRYNRRRGRMVY